MKKSIYCGWIVLAGGFLLSCDDFLDKMPDNRTLLDTPEKIKELLVTSYPVGNYSLITELSSDNRVDNRAPNEMGIVLNTLAFDRMDDEIFAWKEIVSSNDEDSPYFLWESYYQSIAGANHAIQAIEALEAGGKWTESMHSQKGEALVLRAYSHFMLVNIFAKAYKDPLTSQSDLGIPYSTKPETEAGAAYERNSVAEVYDLIAKDLEEGIGLIDDDTYEVPKYHFNQRAAHAFAAKFYLYKKEYAKVVEHADAVLGAGDPSLLLRDWVTIYSNPDAEANAYISADSPANLLLIPTLSVFHRRFQNNRYAHNGKAVRGNISDRGPTWTGRPPFLQGWVWTYGELYGIFVQKMDEYFEFTDKIAGIGYPHCVRTEFTTDATLLDRAEARIFLNDINGAVADLQIWNKSHRATTTLTRQNITAFYTPDRANFVFTFHTSELSPQFVVTPEQKPFVDCVLHFRRLERMYEGDRWFDIKRYGIELEHIIGASAQREYLTYDDDRRAIQIPSDVTGAGLAPNPRPQNGSNGDLKKTLVESN
ncbi:MAG: RagB/SusD family nutrient uptake outer membrane protein [Tannerellaceae bacterium]|jgi:hypothetical protein|nr:RagB/SusD family nutrient uptake outer membrane protein [Tannerellaceae bacterium]